MPPPAANSLKRTLSVAWLAALCAAVWLCVPGHYPLASWPRPFDAGGAWLLARGPATDGNWFPFFPVTLAALQYHLPGWLGGAALRAVLCLPVLLSFSAGLLLRSFAAGAASAGLAALLACAMLQRSGLGYEQNLEQFLVSSTLLALTAGLRAPFGPPLRRGFLVGLLLAMALYSKGVLALCVPAVLAHELLRRDPPGPRRALWPMLALPLGAMAAWAAVGLFSRGEFSLLEAGRAGCNLVTGAMGFVSTVEGDWRALAGLGEEASPLAWAAARVASDPAAFLRAVLLRADYLLLKAPMLPGLAFFAALSAAAAFRLRRNPAAAPLTLITALFALAHLAMPVEGRYFVPAWFLACVLCGTAAADLFPPRGEEEPERGRTALAAFAAGAAPAGLLWAFSFLLLLAFPFRALLPRGAAPPCSGPRCPPYALAAGAREAEASGDKALAASLLGDAYRVERSAQRKSVYVSAAFDAGALSGHELLALLESPGEQDLPVLAALRLAEDGETAAARRLLPCALHLCVAASGSMRYPEDPANAARLEDLRRAGAASCVRMLDARLSRLGKRGEALRKTAGRLYPPLWKPGGLAEDFGRGNAARGGLRAFPGSGPSQDGPLPASCSGALPF